MYKVALNKLIYLQWTLGDRNNFLPSILVPISCKRGKRCNIIFVDVITVHVSLAKTATASNDHIQTQPKIFQVTYFPHRMCVTQSLVMQVTEYTFDTAV
jgi:hypothetical protein